MSCRSIFFRINIVLSFVLINLVGNNLDAYSSFEELSWQEQAQCGTSVVKSIIDVMKSRTQKNGLSPFLFWTLTLADDSLNVYNSWVIRGDNEFYSAFWLMRDVLYAFKDIFEQHTIEGSELFDREYNDQDESPVINAKNVYTCVSPLFKTWLSLYCILYNDDKFQKYRILAQGIKSFVRCGRWYVNSSEEDPKSPETLSSLVFSLANIGLLCKDASA